jgi:Common central domain of tyrosinase
MLGDGIRRDISTISDEERTLFVNAIRKLDVPLSVDPSTPFVYPNNTGNEAADPTGHITYWDMQEQIHKDAHFHGSDVHGGPAFTPWHRDLVNHLEKLIREVDPRLSLHYWDWTTDPRVATADRVAILTGTAAGSPQGFMGSSSGNAGAPFADFESTEITGDPLEGIVGDGVHDHIWRNVAPGPSPVTADSTILGQPDFTSFNLELQNAHNNAHGYIGGTIGRVDLPAAHFSFHDPMVFLLHSNMDRLWAMWQRQPGRQSRLNPATAYSPLPTSDFTEEVAPWSGGASTSLEPWHSDAGQQEHINYLDPSLINPPNYDTAPHSSQIVVNQDTFSNSQVSVQLTFPSAFYLIYEGFEPKELGVTTAAPVPPTPTFTFTSSGGALHTITPINPVMTLEAPGGADDVPQRITIQYDLHFTDASEFPGASGDQTVVNMQASINYNVDTGTGGAVINLSEVTNTGLLLVNQPNPYMLDVDATLSPANPYWLSMDTRVFKVTPGQVIGSGPGAMTQHDPSGTQPNPANDFIQGVVPNFNGLPNDSSHPFLTQLSADETASTLYLPGQDAGQNVYNYAVAKVRYLAPAGVPATNVSVFFRTFSTMVSALDYDHTSGATGNYRRSGDTLGSVPLLGVESNEIASIPFFAAPRVNTVAGTAGAVSMTAQVDDATTNTRTLIGGGAVEQVAYFGCWLDINRTDLRFPRNPAADPGGINGPFTGTGAGNPLLSIQQLMNGFHQCMVAEIFFWPTGVTSDPIQLGASPSSSDRLAQRNLSLVPSSNPGWPEAHTVQHTFLVKPSPVLSEPNVPQAAAVTAMKRGKSRKVNAELAALAAAADRYRGPDELMFQWNNIPQDTQVKIYLPEVLADEILRLNGLRQHPTVLSKLDDHTLSCKVADVGFLPLPGGRQGNLAGLLSLTLPPGVRTGQVYRVNVQQISGLRRKILGGFQLTIPVRTDPEILPGEIAKLSVMKYIQQTVPTGSRWYGIFKRYVDEIAGRVRGLGGDPNNVKPSPNGGEPPEVCHPPKPAEICPPDLWCLNIPWSECDIEGEVDIKLRFRKKCT